MKPWRYAWTKMRELERQNEFTSDACFDMSGIKIGVDYAITDAGATGHFLLPEAPVINKCETTNPLTIHLPDGDKLTSTHTCDVDIPSLPKGARRAHIVPGLAHSSLISIKVLCKQGCTVIYKGNHRKIYYEGKLIWRGVKEPTTNLLMGTTFKMRWPTNHNQKRTH